MVDQHDYDPLLPLSRSPGAARSDKVELRGLSDRELIDVFDAVSFARGMDRMTLVNQVLQEKANQWRHEASLINRVARGNPPAPDAGGGSS